MRTLHTAWQLMHGPFPGNRLYKRCPPLKCHRWNLRFCLRGLHLKIKSIPLLSIAVLPSPFFIHRTFGWSLKYSSRRNSTPFDSLGGVTHTTTWEKSSLDRLSNHISLEPHSLASSVRWEVLSVVFIGNRCLETAQSLNSPFFC